MMVGHKTHNEKKTNNIIVELRGFDFNNIDTSICFCTISYEITGK
jgi:hypothetical protein